VTTSETLRGKHHTQLQYNDALPVDVIASNQSEQQGEGIKIKGNLPKSRHPSRRRTHPTQYLKLSRKKTKRALNPAGFKEEKKKGNKPKKQKNYYRRRLKKVDN